MSESAATYVPDILPAPVPVGKNESQLCENVAGTVVVMTYYGFKMPIAAACRALAAEHRWNVVDFPLFRFRNDQHDRTEHFLTMAAGVVRRTNADAVLLWYHGLERDELAALRAAVDARVKFVIFNWDDPHTWRNPTSHVPRIAPLLDGALTSCVGVVAKYSEAAAAESRTCTSRFCLPGFDRNLALEARERWHGADRFVCDVVFVCTNLYESDRLYPHQRLNRRQLVDALYERHVRGDLVLHLHGPEFLESAYPCAYRGYLSYEQQYEAFRRARVVLTTHVVSDGLDGVYANERTCVALGVGSLLATDIEPPQPGSFEFQNSTFPTSLFGREPQAARTRDETLCSSNASREEDSDSHNGNHNNNSNKVESDGNGTYTETVPHILLSREIETAADEILAAAKMSFETAEDMREKARNTTLQWLTWSHWAERVASLLLDVCGDVRNENAAHSLACTQSVAAGQNALNSTASRGSGAEAVGFGGQNALMPGTWECGADGTPWYAAPRNDEDELKAQLMRTIVCGETEHGALEKLGYARQRELDSLFDQISASDASERQWVDSLRQLRAIVNANPLLDVTSALDLYWRRTDSVP